MSEIRDWKISSRHGKGQVCGKNTEIVISEFRNKYLVIITDCGKVGSLIQVEYHATEFKSPENKSYDAKVIFGRDEPEIQAVALALAEGYFQKSVIFGLSFKEYNQNTVTDVKQLILDTLNESVE